MPIYKYIYSIIGVFLYCMTTSCSKSFLDTPPQNQVPRETYVTDLRTCNETLYGLYNKLSYSFTGYTSLYPEVAADNIRPPKNVASMNAIYNWNQVPGDATGTTLSGSSTNINAYSFTFYQVISISNFIIDRASAFRDENPAMADDIKGQAMFIRALAHFMLVNAFAQSYNYTPGATHPGIVCQTSPELDPSATSRNSVAEVYQLIVNDLSSAAQLIQPAVNNTLRASRNTALSLLSRVMLYQENYQGCISYARQVTDRIPLMQVSKGYPNELYKTIDPSQTEVLLHLLPGGNISQGYASNSNFMGYLFRNSVKFVATKDIGDILTANPGDARSAWVKRTGTEWYITKFPVGTIAGITPAEIAYYFTAVRASEVYLNAAESYANINKEDSAIYFLDLVRKRAFPGAALSIASGQALIDSIRLERRKELCFDGLRLFDMLRWKKKIERTDPNTPEAKTLPYPSDKAISPLPLQDIRLSGLQQNPGYTN